ncbi:Uncharacterised protein [Klebsiella pneumoniae]|nr:Uncharacterised protein [Klebsiella pneumoniae]
MTLRLIRELKHITTNRHYLSHTLANINACTANPRPKKPKFFLPCIHIRFQKMIPMMCISVTAWPHLAFNTNLVIQKFFQFINVKYFYTSFFL